MHFGTSKLRNVMRSFSDYWLRALVCVGVTAAEDGLRSPADEPLSLRSTLAYHGPGATPLILAMLTCQYEGAAALVASGSGWTGIKVCCMSLRRTNENLFYVHSLSTAIRSTA